MPAVTLKKSAKGLRSSRGPSPKDARGKKEIARQSVHTLKALGNQGGKSLNSVPEFCNEMGGLNKQRKSSRPKAWLTVSKEDKSLGKVYTYL